jgi:hypothetical protein
MKVSYSRIDTYKQCPYKYYLRYVLGLKTKFNLDPANPLVIGTAIHTGIEKDVVEAIKGYYANYPSATPLMVNEAIKLEVMINKSRKAIPRGEYELNITDDDFTGFIDLLVKVDKKQKIFASSGHVEPNSGEVMGYEKEANTAIETYDLYDFKHSNNKEYYLKSGQIHLYKYYFEKLNPNKKIRNLYYAFIPKVKLKQDEYESIEDYRKRLIEECEKQEIDIVKVDYEPNKVINFFIDTKHCIECKEFNKNKTSLCYFCDFKNYCQSDGKNDGNIIYPENREVK